MLRPCSPRANGLSSARARPQLVSTATAPTNFVHNIHVGFDPVTQTFKVCGRTHHARAPCAHARCADTFCACLRHLPTPCAQGMPDNWIQMLAGSKISKEDQAKNPTVRALNLRWHSWALPRA